MSKEPTKAELKAELARTKVALDHESREADKFARRVVELTRGNKGGTR